MAGPEKKSSGSSMFMVFALVVMGMALGYVGWRWMQKPTDVAPASQPAPVAAPAEPQAQPEAAPAQNNGERLSG